LFSALRRLAQENRGFTYPLTVVLGTTPVSHASDAFLAIGQCPEGNAEAESRVGGCPPSRDEIEKVLLAHTENSG
jgi:hypothetical protein